MSAVQALYRKTRNSHHWVCFIYLTCLQDDKPSTPSLQEVEDEPPVVKKVSDYIDSAICFDADGNNDLYKNLIEGLKFSVISLPNASIDQIRDHCNTNVKPKRQSPGEGLIVVQNDDEPEHMRNLSSNFVVVIDQASLGSINKGPNAVVKLRRGVHWLTATEGELKTFIRLVDTNHDGKPRQLGAVSRGRDPPNTPRAHFGKDG